MICDWRERIKCMSEQTIFFPLSKRCILHPSYLSIKSYYQSKIIVLIFSSTQNTNNINYYKIIIKLTRKNVQFDFLKLFKGITCTTVFCFASYAWFIFILEKKMEN